MPAAKTPATKAASTTEPKFDTLVADLSKADAAARSASSDANQARNARNGVAVDTIRAAVRESLDPENVRTALVAGGVLKGTASKIGTILKAIEDKHIKLDEVKSLSGAYTAAKAARLAAVSAPFTAGAAATTAPAPTSTATVTMANADDAVALILEDISNAGGGDPDAVFKAAGEWITRLTNEISELTRTVGAAADDDE